MRIDFVLFLVIYVLVINILVIRIFISLIIGNSACRHSVSVTVLISHRRNSACCIKFDLNPVHLSFLSFVHRSHSESGNS